MTPNPVDQVQPQDTRSTRRLSRARVLHALRRSSGSFGDDLAAARVKNFLADPEGSEEFVFVGALPLRRFYAFADKPDKADRPVLWNQLMIEFESPSGEDPGKWGPDTSVSKLQRIVEAVTEKVGEDA